MNIYRKKGNLIEKYEVETINKEGIYLCRKRFGRFFNKDLSTLIDRLLDGDYTVVTKILNMPMPGIFNLKKNFGLKFIDNIVLEDYFRAARFFDITIPYGPVEKDTPTPIFNGFYYGYEKNNLVKYGVRFDIERLINLRTHILAECKNREMPLLVSLIDKLLQGTYVVTEDIFAIVEGNKQCSCEDRICSEYLEVIKKIITVLKYEELTVEEFAFCTDFFNIDCPEDYVPVAPGIDYLKGAYAYEGKTKACKRIEQLETSLKDFDLENIDLSELTEEQRRELELIKSRIDESSNTAQKKYWERELAVLLKDFTTIKIGEKTI